MIDRKTKGDIIFTFFNYTLVTMITIICFYPLWHVASASFSDPILLMKHNGALLWPVGYSAEGWKVVLNNKNIYTGYFNTFLYMFCGTALNMLLSTMGAYALSRKNYMFKKQISIGIVFTMYFSGGIIPNYLLIQTLGIYNTFWAVVLPTAISTWNLIIMKTSFSAIPDSLEESAKIDGANDFIVLYKIFIPVAKATMAVMILFYAVGHWNSWFNASIYLQDRKLFPLQLFLREILISSAAAGNQTTDSDTLFLEEVIKYSTIMVSTVPILFVYPFVQKYFMQGVMLGSLKE